MDRGESTMSRPDDGSWRTVDGPAPISGERRAIEVDGRSLVLWRTELGRLVACDDVCPHQANELSTGFVQGEELICAHHGYAIDVNGWCPDVFAATRVYEVAEEGDVVEVRIQSVRGRSGH